jgi:hypothetical protein
VANIQANPIIFGKYTTGNLSGASMQNRHGLSNLSHIKLCLLDCTGQFGDILKVTFALVKSFLQTSLLFILANPTIFVGSFEQKKH